MGIAVTVSLVAVMVVVYLKFPQVIIEDHCTETKNFDPKQWRLSILHNVRKGDFAYHIISFLWKGIVLERYIGSRRFASMVLKLLIVNEVMIVVAVQAWQLQGTTDTYPSICHGHLWRIVFGMYGLLLHAYQALNPLDIAASFTAELSFVYFLYPAIPLSSLVCGSLAGLLCPCAPQLIISCWSCVTYLFQMIVAHRRLDEIGLVWTCQSCTSENGVFVHACEICRTPRPVPD